MADIYLNDVCDGVKLHVYKVIAIAHRAFVTANTDKIVNHSVSKVAWHERLYPPKKH